jgi:cell fate regulator YaaT (PSP1 superfamily)
MFSVKIRLRKPTRVDTFRCGELQLRRDDRCIVRSERGLEYGICLKDAEPIPEGDEGTITLDIVRKATVSDEADLAQLEVEEQKALTLCAERVAVRQLPMKLVEAEYTLDKNKIVIYFTAADRVDFRQLVRDLAQALKTRIELRHIQVRDEAKLVGGLGVCGRELCCSTWLTEFRPISMRMAKRQNLSLNPSKISGQCGRLLCCLSYENEQYSKKKKPESAPGPEEAGAAEAEPENVAATATAGAPAPPLQDDPGGPSAATDGADGAGEASPTGDPPRADKPKRKRRRKKRGRKKPGGGEGGSPQT